MSQPAVSLHPYFKVHPGKLAAARALLPKFVAKTTSESDCLYYQFTVNGDIVFCREAYAKAEGALAHLNNVGELLGEMMKVSDLVRLEIHGPEDELDKMRIPLAEFKPEWFVYDTGLAR